VIRGPADRLGAAAVAAALDEDAGETVVLGKPLGFDGGEVPGADHRMFVPGQLALSAAVLGDVITAVERFRDAVWAA
jgi:hypothetical protein